MVKAALIDMDYAISVYLDELSQERGQGGTRARAPESRAGHGARGTRSGADHAGAGGPALFHHGKPLLRFDDLKSKFNTAISKLDEAFLDIAASIGQSASDTRELSGATDDMARRTEQQAAALEQTAAAIEQISTISRQSSERTKEARQVVSQTSEQAARSGQTVTEAIAAMGKIEESSKKITQIISVIDEISFQTNLLALNAGVEAAAPARRAGALPLSRRGPRAGPALRIRGKEIKELIEASFADVLTGVELVNKTGEALGSIGGQVQVISDHFATISQAAQEQSTGISEINSSFSAMDQITQQNAAMVEQTMPHPEPAWDQPDARRTGLPFQPSLARAPTCSNGPVTRRWLKAAIGSLDCEAPGP